MTTTIEWTETVWNPVTGCDRVSSPGCDHCYALSMARRLKAMGQAKYQADGDARTSGPGFGVTTHPDALQTPLRWRKPRTVFVNSMSDLFHPRVPEEFIARIWAIMALTPQHTYQLLTKRHARMRALLGGSCRCGHPPGTHLRAAMAWAVSAANPDRIPGVPEDAEHRVYHQSPWPLPNVWLGVSAEDPHWAEVRIPALLQTPAALRWVSAEPLLGPMGLRPGEWLPPLGGGPTTILGRPWEEPAPSLDWVVVGGESGPRARRCSLGWIRHIINECQHTGVPVFVKQLGTHQDRHRGKGNTLADWPEDLRVREMPAGRCPR